MGTNKKYWKGLPELHVNTKDLGADEFKDGLPMQEALSSSGTDESGTSRRDFLKVMGFTTAAVALASCETPVIKAIPYVNKPQDITPGVANFYASTFYDGHDYCPVLVKTREGRPIKIEPNDVMKHGGGTSARVQASVLGLYDGARLGGPWSKGAATSWSKLDTEIGHALASIGGKEIALVSSTIISPSTWAVISELRSKYPSLKVYQYDSVSYSALREANNRVWGKKAVSSYHFHEASKVIVGIACDFLGNWLSPVHFAAGYSRHRKVTKEKPEMSKHYHFEANMSLTGANADERYSIKPSEIGKVVVALYNEVAKATGATSVAGAAISSNPDAQKAISKIAKELAEAKGKSLVVCGLNDNDVQVMVAGINKMLENYGKTIDVEHPLSLKQGDDQEFMNLISDMGSGKVGAVMLYNCNPVYTSPLKSGFTEAFKKVALKISFSQVMDESALLCDYVCPDHNWLESWGDASPSPGHYSLQQPAINPIFSKPRFEGTRQAQDTFLKWAGVKSDYYTYLQANWQNRIFPLQGKYNDFFSFWSNSLHDGWVHIPVSKPVEETVAPLAKDSAGNPLMAGIATLVSDSTMAIKDEKKLEQKELKDEKVAEETKIPAVDYSSTATRSVASKSGAWEITVYEKIGMGNGNFSNSPWLHELPDPISKVTWDQYITMSPDDLKDQGFEQMLRQDLNGTIAELTVNGIKIELPVYPQPGQAKGTLGVSLGFGRKAESLKVAAIAGGANAFEFLSITNGTIQNISPDVNITSTGKKYEFAATQIQHTIMGREEWILRETSLEQYKNDAASNNPKTMIKTHSGEKPVGNVDLWAAHDRPDIVWGMTIDMSSCIGCAACVVACSAENNVPVVGKDQIRRTRDMYWLRIDRYYSSDMTRRKAKEDHIGSRTMYLDMENPSSNPKVTFQPIMCQHCNHAPCETVCPVLATNHSNEGLNQMAYNRCIGTRYCANNCPFKVRRFNWYNYNTNSDYAAVNPIQQDLGRMVLNPDVVVRGRGVMEKCSMCQQRLQAGKLDAKKAGRRIIDGDVKTACQQSCPTQAITFGDLTDDKSAVAKTRENERNYFLLEDIGIRPTVSYLVKVRNQEEEISWEAEPEVQESSEKKEEKS